MDWGGEGKSKYEKQQGEKSDGYECEGQQTTRIGKESMDQNNVEGHVFKSVSERRC